MSTRKLDELINLVNPDETSIFWLKDNNEIPPDRNMTFLQLQNWLAERYFKENLQVVHVSKSGDDSNSGLSSRTPMLTIGAAIAQADSIQDSNIIAVYVDDAGDYEENITLPSGIHLYAPYAGLLGTLVMNGNCSVTLDRQFSTANSQTLVSKLGSVVSSYRARRLEGHLHNVVTCVQNATNNSILFVDIDIIRVGTFGKGIQDFAAVQGHIHFKIMDLYLQGDTCRGIDAGGSSYIIGFLDHIFPIGTLSGDRALSVANGGKLVLTAGEITATQAFDIGETAELYLNCLHISGTRTGTPTAETWHTGNTEVDGSGFIKIPE